MNRRIKNFICKDITQDGLNIIENEINDFAKNNNILDIKVSSVCNNFGFALVYTVIYEM